jgi:chromosomal replication initiator protein
MEKSVLDKKWKTSLEEIKNSLEKMVFSTYIKDLKVVSFSEEENVLFLTTGNPISKTMVETHHRPLIEEKARCVFGMDLSIAVLLPTEIPQKGKRAPKIPFNMNEENLLNPRYNFDTFVIGDNNRFAHAASLAVADCPGKAYNPLFIYGGSGLGKTHLMNAIGHRIVDKNNKTRVLYVSSETFTNEFINATSSNTMNEFKTKYRNIDVLMIDDIQFLMGKEKTVEEIFHTYNTLYDLGKQIVFSSDRATHELTFDTRMKSRLASGLSVDIRTPDYETKIAILKNKAVFDNIEITEGVQEVIDIIAERVKSNIREMEGAFNRVIAYSTLTNKPINKLLARDILHDILSEKDAMPTGASIKKKTARAFGISLSDLEGKKRNREISFPRQVAMYLCRELTDMSLPQIGEIFTGRDHTTVLHAIKKVETLLEYDSDLKEVVSVLIKDITNI